MTVLALLGAKAFWLLLVWLASAIAASYLSDRKGYGEKAGLVTGILLTFVGVVIWLIWPAKRDSRWKLQGPLGRGDGRTVAQLRAEHAEQGKEKA